MHKTCRQLNANKRHVRRASPGTCSRGPGAPGLTPPLPAPGSGTTPAALAGAAGAAGARRAAGVRATAGRAEQRARGLADEGARARGVGGGLGVAVGVLFTEHGEPERGEHGLGGAAETVSPEGGTT